MPVRECVAPRCQHIQFKFVGRYFGERLADALRSSGKTQTDIAEAFGISQQQVSKWVTGQADVGTKRATVLARLLGVDRGEVLAWMADDSDAERKSVESRLEKAVKALEKATLELAPARQFVAQYEELGHSYRQMGTDLDTLRKDVDQLKAEINARMDRDFGILLEGQKGVNAQLEDLSLALLDLLSRLPPRPIHPPE